MCAWVCVRVCVCVCVCVQRSVAPRVITQQTRVLRGVCVCVCGCATRPPLLTRAPPPPQVKAVNVLEDEEIRQGIKEYS